MITAVKIWTPTGSFKRPSSINTLATTPRLDSDSTPANPRAWVKLRSSCRSNRKSVVTARDTRSDMTTDNVEATKRRPRIEERNPLMSSSSRPMRKKNMKIPMARMNSTSGPGLTSPVTGPRMTPVVAYATIEFRPNRLNMPSMSLAATMSRPTEKRASCMSKLRCPPQQPILRGRSDRGRIGLAHPSVGCRDYPRFFRVCAMCPGREVSKASAISGLPSTVGLVGSVGSANPR